MTRISPALLLRTFLFSFLILGSYVGCVADEANYECVADADCGVGKFCENNACLCKTNDACGEGSYCNTWGACQPRPPCLSNDDCPDGEICNSADPSGGKCILASRCGSSVHCELNQYCDPQTETCQPGCRNTGDCQLGYICVGGSCTDGKTGNDCTQCPTSPDPDSTYCDYGEICNTNGQCVSHAQQNSLCQACSSDPFQFMTCPSNMLCLLDDAQQGAEYCTPFCSTSADCPNGYNSCNGIQIAANGTCTSDSDCAGDRRCLGSSEGVVSTCSCLNNTDCPQDGALCLLGSCANLGNPCDTNADCEVQCTMVDYGNAGQVGVCETKAKACGKGEGMNCGELKTGQADCVNF